MSKVQEGAWGWLVFLIYFLYEDKKTAILTIEDFRMKIEKRFSDCW